MRHGFLLCALLAASANISFAQEQEEKKPERGYLTGSFETNTNYYQNDGKTGAVAPDSHFGSNNYLKLDYYRGKLAVGVQMEAYESACVGYPTNLDGVKLTNYYATWADEDFTVTAGSFYDQFGSGLLFRAWEDRALGLNNALLGARFTYNYKDIVAVKAIWGLPRFGMDYTSTQARGADASFAISNLAGWDNVYFALEGSVLNRYEKFTDHATDKEELGLKPYTTGFSGRFNLEASGFSVKGEYVDAGDKILNNPESEGDAYIAKRGNAQLLEIGYNNRGLGVNVTARRLAWMKQNIVDNDPTASTSNMLNYIPAMCTQYTYMLACLNPYTSQIGNLMTGYSNPGEIGGQVDAYYHFKRGTAIGGKRGLKLHANFSTYYTLNDGEALKAENLLYRDLSVDVEKQWNKQFKTMLMYSRQEYSPSHGISDGIYLSNVIIADLQYKFTQTFSTRMELQYLASKDDQKDWMAALLEFNFAPKWSVYGSDMYNHGGSKTNYYNVGVSYAKSRTRIALGYGRYKAGYICSGGVCRSIPAYTGANLSITTSF